jgi:hypothetical protein
VVLGRAGAERSQRIVARIRYQVNNYLLGMYSNTCSVLGKGAQERAAVPRQNTDPLRGLQEKVSDYSAVPWTRSSASR